MVEGNYIGTDASGNTPLGNGIDGVLITGGAHGNTIGGLTATPIGEGLEKDARKVIEKAVWGMLPKNKLGRQVLKKLKVYSGPHHPHQAQQATPFEISQISQ